MKKLIPIFIVFIASLIICKRVFQSAPISCLQQSDNVKVVIFTPISHADQIRKTIGKIGAGKIGNYAFCSFTIKGTGRWVALDGAHPAIGEIGS